MPPCTAGRMRRPECYTVRLSHLTKTLAVPVFLPDADALFGGERPNWRATNSLSVSACFSEARSHPLPDQCPLELRDCAKYLEHQLAGRQGRVYRLRRGHEVNPELAEQFECRHELPQRPGEPVELPNKPNVKLPLPCGAQRLVT